MVRRPGTRELFSFIVVKFDKLLYWYAVEYLSVPPAGFGGGGETLTRASRLCLLKLAIVNLSLPGAELGLTEKIKL